MSDPILLKTRGNYPKQSFGTLAAEAWLAFFQVAPADCDLAFWLIYPDSGTIRMSGRTSSINEDDPEWEPPTPIIVRVEGIVAALNDAPRESLATLKTAFWSWATTGILKAFESKAIAAKYRAFLPKDGVFGIVATDVDEGLAGSELALLWASEKSLTLSSIAKAQTAARKRPRKAPGKFVKKKSTRER